VYAHLLSRPEEVIGVLDTYHSQAGHAVARACGVLGKKCMNFYPEFVGEPGYREPQARALALGATLHGLKAGRSAVIYHQARKLTEAAGGYTMPNALKLPESVSETAREVPSGLPFGPFDAVIIPSSSGTIAAGVIRGFAELLNKASALPEFVVHLGYSRSHKEVLKYLGDASCCRTADAATIVDEGYSYKDEARPGPTPEWPCNTFYDLKAFRWYQANRERFDGRRVLLWNVG
jgi:hypothetical protein